MEFFARKRTQNRTGIKRETNFSRQILRGLSRLLFIGILLTAVWYGTRLSMFTIKEISVEGGETISHDTVRAEIEEELTGSYFLFVPKRFTYLYPHERIVEKIGKISRAHNVVVARISKTGLNVSFEEYLPYALWCSGEGESPCWFLSSDGYAFAEAPVLHGGTLMRHLVPGDGEVLPGGVMSEENLRAIDTFVSRAEEELDFRITALTHKKNGDIEFLINGGGIVRASLGSGRDLSVTFENLKSVLTSPEFNHLEPGNFQYVDVRFENKVFVNEELIVESATTTGTTTGELPE